MVFQFYVYPRVVKMARSIMQLLCYGYMISWVVCLLGLLSDYDNVSLWGWPMLLLVFGCSQTLEIQSSFIHPIHFLLTF